MMTSFKNTILALFWSITMLIFLLYIFALLFLQGMTQHMIDRGADMGGDAKGDVIEHFGSMGKSLFTLYSTATGGADWTKYYTVVQMAGPVYSALFIFFTAFITLSVFNIITGFFVENAVSAASPDRDDMVLASKRKAREEAKEFRHLCW